MNVLEVGMLLCFGASWPFSVHKTWKAKTCKGRSLIFLWLVLVGYGFGIAHKVLYSPDPVILFYIVNGAMVLADLILCTLYNHREKLSSA
ncbi:MAG: hypothetical protein WCI20_13575 [bacterium]